MSNALTKKQKLNLFFHRLGAVGFYFFLACAGAVCAYSIYAYYAGDPAPIAHPLGVNIISSILVGIGIAWYMLFRVIYWLASSFFD